MLYVMNCKKLTNAWVINSVTDISIFQVSITVFKDFSTLFHTYDHFKAFQGLEKFYIKFQDCPYFSMKMPEVTADILVTFH